MMETLGTQIPAAFNLISSRSSDGSVTVAPRYQPMGYWSQNPSYLLGSRSMHQCPKYVGQPLKSLSADFQTRNTNSLTPTKALPSSYDNLSQVPIPTSVQQQQRANAPLQYSLQASQTDLSSLQTSAVNIPSHGYYSPSPAPQRFSFPPMKQSLNLSHSPSNRFSPLRYAVTRIQAQDRPLKCGQCPQSFKRNHDLKRHKRIHLAMKPFPCGYCEKNFSRKDALKRHIRLKGCGRNANGVSSLDLDENIVFDNSEVTGDLAEGESLEI